MMEQCQEQFSRLVSCELMTLRPERLLAHAKDSGPSGSQYRNRQSRVYPDYETAQGRCVLSPPQKVNEEYLFDYIAFHSLKEVEGGWSWKFQPGVFEHSAELHENLLAQGTRMANPPGPIVIVYGQQSALFDVDSAAYVRECGGGHRPMIKLPNARHRLLLDQPVAFAWLLKAILVMSIRDNCVAG
ncbi:MAG: pimeloyl-ACP methyl ester carboxylesterase [Halioglobus sp.]|jgi:pimeloyl-ACP methyl ester carboxylesterase